MIEKIADDLIGQMTEARLIDKVHIPQKQSTRSA